tara:strand:+ start:520 stop:714 length:195 start_codon:yes stop_codon:yes gene_type:complete
MKIKDKDIQKYYKSLGWKPFDTTDGHTWFGGKSHYPIAEFLPEEAMENVNFEDIDFLVVGWRTE